MSAADARPPFPFLVGCGRSGTTLLRAMLDAHPDITVPDEVGFVIRYARPHYAVQYGWPLRFAADRCADLLADDGSLRRWPLSGQQVRAAVTDPPAGSYADAVRRLYGAVAAAAGTARYADKTPMHVLHMRRLARTFPESRFVHVIRDGRDVAQSYLGVAWGPTTVEEAAIHWRRSVRHGLAGGRRLGPPRYHEVRYEELVADPERVMRGVTAFVGLPWDDAVLHHHERADAVIAATRFPDAHAHLHLPPTPGLRDWRRDMAADDVARFEAVAGPLLGELGYGRATGRGGAGDRAVAEVRSGAATARRASIQAVAGVRVLARGARRIGGPTP